MGCFTWVEGAPGGPVQVKFGDDDQATLGLGDMVRWCPDFYSPGAGVDDVHEGHGDGWDDDAAVVVRDARIVAIVPAPYDRDQLRAEYALTDPDPSLWPDEAWEARRRREGRHEQERLAREAEFRQHWREAAPRREAAGQTPRTTDEAGGDPNQRLFDLLAIGDPLLVTDEEQAVIAWAAISAVNDFTRCKLREDGFLRQIMSTWEDVSAELAELVGRRLAGWNWSERPAVRRAWQDHWGEVDDRLRSAAANWVAEEELRERQLLRRITDDKRLSFGCRWRPERRDYEVSLRRNTGLMSIQDAGFDRRVETDKPITIRPGSD